MLQTYEYNGFTLHVAIESDFRPHSRSLPRHPAAPDNQPPGYVAVVRICDLGSLRSRFSALRLGKTGGLTFSSQADAMREGLVAARRMVDDLLY